MLFFLLIASAYKAYALPTPLGPEAFSSTPFTILYARSACNCGPQDRALVDIIRSCVLTIFACIYTALHPNIPDPEANAWQKICKRLKISFYMLIAPEAVIWWAMRQWYGAREIAKAVNKINPKLNWTTTHGHFVQMGGLEGIYPDGRREVMNPLDFKKWSWLAQGFTFDERLDPKGLQFPKKQVEDRSKGDFLSKGLVALQTSWFVIECIARFQKHLPITELEVVTLAFAVLNIITYGFWWDKPLNVNCQVQVYIISEDGPGANESRDDGGSQVERDGQQVPEAGKADGNGQDQGNGDAATTKASTFTQQLLHLPRWAYDRLIMRPFTALVLPIQDLFKCERIKDGASHVPMFYGYELTHGPLLRIRLMSSVIGMTFGAIHFIAWDSHFPTHVELIIWRSSSLVVLVIPFFIGLFGVLLRDWDFDPTKDHAMGAKTYGPVVTAILRPIRWVLYVLGPILYILARVSLIVLAFISLRDLQPKVLQNVAWTSYIPHL
ncbi:hypothetical protein BDN72DRAFT_849562 [Pluteus cervinus]|uniref:Uncharacterized protein n=1 Tax=Pluteus cervinus TaxID=181527 RepID=A0ACD3A798_9AGAR|nr:hypothetical protein BDN72DRAFT_849562 [Pluteus cervinus]